MFVSVRNDFLLFIFQCEIRFLVHSKSLTVYNINAIIDRPRFYKTVELNIFTVHTFLRYGRTSCSVRFIFKYTDPNVVVFI